MKVTREVESGDGFLCFSGVRKYWYIGNTNKIWVTLSTRSRKDAYSIEPCTPYFRVLVDDEAGPAVYGVFYFWVKYFVDKYDKAYIYVEVQE